MISDWVKNHETNEHTGVLLWDLSAAFDTLDVNILCQKLKLYGANDRAVRLLNSFLTNRRQQVRIGDTLSEIKTTSIGCPQGSLLSPLLFLVYVADVEHWVQNMKIRGYADDTASSVHSPDIDKVTAELESNGGKILRFMASNMLVANPDKTGLLIIRARGTTQDTRSIVLGGKIVTESPVHKILGMTINNKLTWDDHIYGKGGLISSLNSKLGAIKRISYHVPAKYTYVDNNQSPSSLKDTIWHRHLRSRPPNRE